MITEVGYASLILALLVSFYSILAARQGKVGRDHVWLSSASAGLKIAAVLCSISIFCLGYVLVEGYFEVSYVYSVTSSNMPALLRITALWAGQEGSLLVFCWLLAAISSLAVSGRWVRDRDLLPWIIMILAATLAFFLFLVIFIENPFVRLWRTVDGQQLKAILPPAKSQLIVPLEGAGLNPLLRHPGMIIHPPMLYLGFIGFMVPYAYAMVALFSGRTDGGWLHATRRWTLIAWIFLSLGLILGSRWAYDVLGWGGYWGWDPVEIAALMPWLSATAYIHSMMIQEKRGIFKRWNIMLIMITYALVIFGIFLTRSGLLSSVHAYAQSSIGSYFFVFITVSFTLTLYMLVKRWDELRGQPSVSSLLSRESLFLINNLIFIGILAVCFWGVVFPLFSELLTGARVVVGPPFFEQASAPLLIALLVLMGIAPLSAWGCSTFRSLGRCFWIPLSATIACLLFLFISGTTRSLIGLTGLGAVIFSGLATLYEAVRLIVVHALRRKKNIIKVAIYVLKDQRRRYGAYLVHLGVVLMAFGIIGIEQFQHESQVVLLPGESTMISDYKVTYQEMDSFDSKDGRLITRAVLNLSQGGKSLGNIHPRREYYYDVEQQITIPGIYSNLAGEVYTILLEWHPDTDGSAVLSLYYNPMINWLWIGSLLLVVGGAMAAWPGRKRYA